METNPLNEGMIAEDFSGVGTVTKKMVRERAVELALINGRTAQDVSQTDWEQAKRELTGKSDLDPGEALLDDIPESKDGDALPGSDGLQVPELAPDGEDSEGRSVGERLIEQGVNEADHDLMLQAAKKQNREGNSSP